MRNGGSSPTEPEWVTQLLKWREPYVPIVYMAPENMRLADRNNHIFDPVLVSIGPFHHGKFPAMAEHKTRTLSSMLDRHPTMDRRTLLMELVVAVGTLEEFAREWYSKSFPEIDFVKMMVFDGCFLLEIFRMHAGIYLKHEDDPISKARWMLPALALDIVKLENQLPYFVLNELHKRTRLPGEPTLNQLAGSFLASLFPILNGLVIEDNEFRDHLLSLFHSTFVPKKKNHHCIHTYVDYSDNSLHSIPDSSPSVPGIVTPVIKDEGNFPNSDCPDSSPPVPMIKDEGNCPDSSPSVVNCPNSSPSAKPSAHIISISESKDEENCPNSDEGNCPDSSPSVTDICFPGIKDEGNCPNSFPSVTDLSLAGIKVVKKKRGRTILDIDYKNNELKIPTLVIDHSTKILMSNLVAYEQCNNRVQDIFTSYVTFMDALVNSAEDVEMLRKDGVISHFMNSNKEVCLVLNDLTANINYNMYKGYLADLNAQIYSAHHIASARLSSRFKRLVNSREGMISLAIAFVGFYLAALQTVFTVLSYGHT